MANRIISKEINLNNSSNKYITEINNNGIQIHEAGYNASNYDKNIILNSSGIQLNSGNLQLMGLDEDSLDFYTVDTINNQSNPVASFSSNGTLFSNTVIEDNIETTYTTMLNSNLSFLKDDETIASFSSEGATIGSDNNTNLNISSSGVTINNGLTQYASFSSEGLELNTKNGTNAIGIYTTGSSQESIIRKHIGYIAAWRAGTVFTANRTDTSFKTLLTDITPDSCGPTGIKIRYSPTISKEIGSKFYYITIGKSRLQYLTNNDYYLDTWENIASYTNNSQGISMSIDLTVSRSKDENDNWTNWSIGIVMKRKNTKSTDYTLKNNWYGYIYDAQYTTVQEAPKNMLYGSTLIQSLRTIRNVMINSFMRVGGFSAPKSLITEWRSVGTEELHNKFGNAFDWDEDALGIVCSSGTILVWGNIRLGDGFSSASAVYARIIRYDGQDVKTELRQIRIRASSTVMRTDFVIPPTIVSVKDGDQIWMEIKNNTDNIGNIDEGNCHLCALYLGPELVDTVE